MTFPLATLAAAVSVTGITAPSYADILASLQASFRTIFGSDAYLEPDGQDGQLLAIFAQAIYDANQTAIAVYNAYSPSTAQGTGLSSGVKINGLRRLVPSKSTVVVDIVGQVGTVINSGVVADANHHQWTLPSVVTIPVSGAISVTATCTEDGAVTADIGTVTTIATPTRGWQTVTNAAAAAPGQPVEADATLRRRQSVSTALPAQSVIAAIRAAILNLDGVTRCMVYENDTDVTDGNGQPEHSIAAVVENGDVDEIAAAIALKKTPGTATYGTTSVIIVDDAGVPSTIHFFALTPVTVTVEIDITALSNFVLSTVDDIKAAVVATLTALDIGEDSYLSKLYTPANLDGDALGKTYNVTAIRQARDGGSPAAGNVSIDFTEAATCTVDDITVTVS